MINKILCYIFGHKWKIDRYEEYFFEHRIGWIQAECERCKSAVFRHQEYIVPRDAI